MATKTLAQLQSDLQKLRNNLKKDYAIRIYSAPHDGLTAEDVDAYIIQKNKDLGRHPFFLHKDEQKRMSSLMVAGLKKVWKGLSAQAALKEAGQKLVQIMKEHIDADESDGNPEPYHPDYIRQKTRIRGTLSPHLKLTGKFYKSLRYAIRRV